MNVNESAPIENFLLDRVKNSLHASIQILWILENYLIDLKSSNNRNAATYLKTARILLEVQKCAFRYEISDSAFQITQKQLQRATHHLETFYGTKSNFNNSANSFLFTGPPIIAFGAMISAFGQASRAKISV